MKNNSDRPLFQPLPMSRRDMEAYGWSEIDILLVTGDAYIDHPSFGTALIGRVLVSEGYRVGVVAQPRWDTTDDICAMGRPRLFAGVTSGALDSMLAHYTAFRKLRHGDAFTPGNRHGARPNRASLVYTGLLRQAFSGLPVVLGGVEASMRRASHYDFWSDKLRRSILLDSKADLLVYGMGERAVLEIARRLSSLPAGSPDQQAVLRGIPGTVFSLTGRTKESAADLIPSPDKICTLPSHEDILASPAALMTATLTMEEVLHQGRKWMVQLSGAQEVYFTPPAAPMNEEEMDRIYALPFTRRPHPVYKERIPAADMIQFSITAHRGCAAGCTFCSITLHQGRQIQSRSRNSIVAEAASLTKHPDWKGSISDVGGPTANMWGAYCADDPSSCRRPDCLYPRRCPHFKCDEAGLVGMLQEVAALEGVRHLRVSSGVRYDMSRENTLFMRTLISDFVGGQLKVAPEHSEDRVLALMRKPSLSRFEEFLALFRRESQRAGKEQYVVPYLISAFPGCTAGDMRKLAAWLKERNWSPQQLQCFIPTPGTVATAMFYAGIDTKMRPIPVARTDRERMIQHQILMPGGGKKK